VSENVAFTGHNLALNVWDMSLLPLRQYLQGIMTSTISWYMYKCSWIYIHIYIHR